MSKLFKLKEWLTVPETAKHLSIAFGEDVTEADILRFALDGHLSLSVYFVNHAYARRGKVVKYSDAELFAAIESGRLPEDLKWTKFPRDVGAAIRGEPGGEEVDYLMSLRIDEDRYLTLSDEVTKLDGVWDLPMIGGERLDVEHLYQQFIGGPSVTLQTLDGSFVEGLDGAVCQLQESFDDNEYQSGSLAALEKIKKKIDVEEIDPEEASSLLKQHSEKRKEYLERRKSRPNKENYYPAGGLPEDAVFVVRTSAIRKLEESLSDTQSTLEKDVTPIERNTLLAIIAGLCDYSAIKYQERGAPSQISKMTEEIGAAVSPETVARHLKKIPDALATRMK